MKTFQKFLFSIVLIFPGLLSAQIIQGSIYDRGTGKALDNVTIQAINTPINTRTNRQGFFSFKGLEKGVYVFRISRPGYELKETTVVIAEDSLRSLGVSLAPSAKHFDRSKTTLAHRFERSAFLSPMAISQMDRQQIKYNGNSSFPEVAEGLTGVWGNISHPGSGSLMIRGFTGNNILTLVDGIRLNNTTLSTGDNFIQNLIDPMSIENIEVLRGAGSVQYGSDALMGAIQVQTIEPRFSDQGIQVHGSVTGRYMSQNLEKALRGEIELNSSKVSIHAGYTRRNFGDRTVGNKETLEGSDYQGQSADVKAAFKLASNHKLTLAYQYYDQDSISAWDRLEYEPFDKYETSPRKRQLSYARMTSYYQAKWFKKVAITASFQQLSTEQFQQRDQQLSVRESKEEVDTWGASVEVLSQPSRYWNIVSGVEYYLDNVSSKALINLPGTTEDLPKAGSFPNGSSSTNLSLYSLHTLDILKLRLSFGGRANAFKLDTKDPTFGQQSLTPLTVIGNISGMYPLHPNYHLVSSFNTGYRSPNLNEMSSYGPFSGGIEVPNDSLAAERSFTSEIGLKAKTDHFSGSLIFYRTQLRDLIDQTPANYLGSSTYQGDQVYKQVNIAQAYVQGVEAEVEVPVNHAFALFGSLAYTYGQNLTKDEPLSKIPPMNSRLGLRYKSKIGIWSRLEWRYASLQDRLSPADLINPRIDNTGTPGWNVVNVHIGYDFAWGYATLGVQNVFDESYRLHGSGVNGLGRMVLISLQLGF